MASRRASQELPSKSPSRPPSKSWEGYMDADDNWGSEVDPPSLFGEELSDSGVEVQKDKTDINYPRNALPRIFAAAARLMGVELPPVPASAPCSFTKGVTVGRIQAARMAKLQPAVCPKLMDVWQFGDRETAAPLASRLPVSRYVPYSLVEGVNLTEGIPPLTDAMRAALMPGLEFHPGCSGVVPRADDQTTAAVFNRIYMAATQVRALANNLAFLFGALDRLSVDRLTLDAQEVVQVQNTAVVALRMTEALSILGGRLQAEAQVGHRHLWLKHSSLPAQDKMTVLRAPLTGSLFGPEAEELIAYHEAAAKAPRRFCEQAQLGGSSQPSKHRLGGRSASLGPPGRTGVDVGRFVGASGQGRLRSSSLARQRGKRKADSYL